MEKFLYEGNLLGLPVVYWLVCRVVCYDHKFIGAGTENLMELISPAALQQVAGEWKYGGGLLPGRHACYPQPDVQSADR
jgi:hypothetical protein